MLILNVRKRCFAYFNSGINIMLIGVGFRYGKLTAVEIQEETWQEARDEGGEPYNIALYAIFDSNGGELWARAEIRSGGLGSEQVKWINI